MFRPHEVQADERTAICVCRMHMTARFYREANCPTRSYNILTERTTEPMKVRPTTDTLLRAIVFPMRDVARDAVTPRSVRSLEQKFARPLFYDANQRSGK